MVLPDFILIFGILLGGVAVYVAVSALLDSLTANNNIGMVWASGEAPIKSKSGIIRLCRPAIHRLVLPLLARYPMKEYKEKIKREIQSAGLGKELNENEYVGLQVFLGVMLPIFLFVSNILFNLEYPLWLTGGFGLIGACFPYFYVKSFKDLRRWQILADLPFVVDLLALSTEAGLDFIGAISRVVEKMELSALGEELGQVLRDLKLGSSRSEALNAMAWRLNMGEVTSFIAVLTTADSLGASIGGVLRQQSEQLRQERFMRAEKAGGEASQKIFLPIILFILPAVLIMVLVQLFCNLWGLKDEARD